MTCKDRAMPERLSASDASFLRAEQAVMPVRIAGVASFPGARSGFDHAAPSSRGEPLTGRGVTRVNVVVSTVRQPPVRPDAAGVPGLDVRPVVSLSTGRVPKGQPLAIGFTSHGGCMYYGFNAGRDAMGDGDMLAGMIPGSLDELAGSVD
jgi:hypothetical protein